MMEMVRSVLCTRKTIHITHRSDGFDILVKPVLKPNLIGTNVCVQNRWVFCLCRLKETKISYIWTLFKVCTEFSINSAFGLDKFHCNCCLP